jgi:formate hydrogenlyase transcriptional activator
MEENHKKLEIELQELLRFETLISDLSLKLVNIHSNEINQVIEQSLEQIVEFLDVDRSTLFELSEDKTKLYTIASYARKGLTKLTTATEEHGSELFPYIREKIIDGEIWIFEDINKLPSESRIDRENLIKSKLKSGFLVPIPISFDTRHALAIGTISTKAKKWPGYLLKRLQILGIAIVNAIMRCHYDKEIRESLAEIIKLKELLTLENVCLIEEIENSHNFYDIIGRSPSLHYVIHQVEEVAPTNSTVMIHGETGTGKNIFARAIHNLSNRRDHTFVTVNCAAIPAELVESELFGREKGAYTGADSSQIGRFELASGGTIFLDEISELPYQLQAKLLKVIQEGEFEHLGNPKSIKVDVRIVSSTNRDLKELIKDNKFREDLYYRLNVYPIVIPPLNQRKNDIQLLVNHFVNKHSRKMGKSIDKIPAEAIKKLKNFQWPGNVRELENVIERAVITTKGDTLSITSYVNQSDLMDSNRNDRVRLYDVECDHIVKVLNDTDWKIEGNSGAAVALGLPPSTLRARMKKLGIKRLKINH